MTVVPMMHKVCFEGYVNTVHELLNEGEDVNQRIEDGPKLLRFLHGGFVTYTAFFLHSTPLMMAAHQGHVPILKLLIRKGAKVDQRDNMGCSAFSLAVSSQRMDACRLLLKYGADINSVDHKYNFTPIILACRKNDTELAKWLIKKGANVRLTDVYGRTPLHYAAWNYNQELVRLLLSLRLDVNGRDFYGWSPIHYAVGELELDPTPHQESGLYLQTGGLMGVKTNTSRGLGKGGEEWMAIVALTDNGADPNHIDPTGRTPLHILAERLPSAVLCEGQVKVSERKKNELILIAMMLLIDKGGNIHQRNAKGMSVMEVCRARENFMADRLFDQLNHSISLTTLNTPTGSISMASTSTSLGFHRHFSVDAMEEEIRNLVDMLLFKVLTTNYRKSLRKKYNKGCVIS